MFEIIIYHILYINYSYNVHDHPHPLFRKNSKRCRYCDLAFDYVELKSCTCHSDWRVELTRPA